MLLVCENVWLIKWNILCHAKIYSDSLWNQISFGAILNDNRNSTRFHALFVRSLVILIFPGTRESNYWHKFRWISLFQRMRCDSRWNVKPIHIKYDRNIVDYFKSNRIGFIATVKWAQANRSEECVYTCAQIVLQTTHRERARAREILLIVEGLFFYNVLKSNHLANDLHWCWGWISSQLKRHIYDGEFSLEYFTAIKLRA